ncbi:MAG TPA: sugar ABC transporter permease [Acholeplasma sp.]|nr:sugar ABC transporter permease [Acholeplasma sp.]
MAQKGATKNKTQYKAFIWLAPALTLLLVFSYYPPIRALMLSFTNARGTGVGEFIAFQNYIEIFTSEVFWISMRNVVMFIIVGMIVGNFMTILLAELLFNLKSERLRGIFRYLFILPILVPGVVVILIWRFIVFAGGDNGIANMILGFLGLESSNWYFDPSMAAMSIILTGFPWVAGTSFLIYLAGLQNISYDVIEASRLDGANMMQRIFKVDLPLIGGQLKYFVVMGIIGGLQNINLQVLITGSGPGTTNATNVPAFMLYEAAFTYDRYGFASAIGIVIFAMTLGLTILNMKKIKGGEQ